MTDETKKALVVARLAHKGQTRRDKITPYITHPIAVMEMVEDRLKPIALLHDSGEYDAANQLSVQDLIDLGFSTYVICGVIDLTRNELAEEPYDYYIKYRVLPNPDACAVKIADMVHNLSCNPSENSKKKISKWLPILKEAIK